MYMRLRPVPKISPLQIYPHRPWSILWTHAMGFFGFLRPNKGLVNLGYIMIVAVKHKGTETVSVAAE